MTIDVQILLTDWEWVEQSRPELRVNAVRTTARLEMGPHAVEFSDDTPDNLALQFEGMAELFAEAARQVRGATILEPEGEQK
jgi:hypothetical protein